jgi:thiol:disulfide interchange protein
MLLTLTRLCFFFILFAAGAARAAPVQAEHATVELIAAQSAIVPGASFDLAVRFKLEEHWHIYWQNPGASGLATSIEWTLPEGIEAGEIQWPAPERIELGGLMSYGYEEEVVLIVTMRASDTLEPGQTLSIAADLFWLICKEACLPGGASLEISMPVAAKALPGVDAVAFEKTRARQPKEQSPWVVSAYPDNSELGLVIEGEAIPDDLYFYAEKEGYIDPNEKQTLSYPASKRAELRLPLDVQFLDAPPNSIRGILQSGEKAWQVTVEIGDAPPARIHEPTELESVGFEQGLLSLGLPGFLALAFLGGLILNIMPCVLPVLSLKVFSLLKHAGHTRSDALRHGLAYTSGVVLSFLALAGALFLLRAVGEQIGWGFQLQSPGFVVVLTAIFFLFGLNLLGVYELGSRLVGADASISRRNDLFGSFGMGVLAAVVGAPCMGPLVAGVSGLAVQASVGTGLLIFGMMGLGLASPFLLLSVFPKLVGFLPKPGLWMESFKQGMGFLLMAAAAFLIYVAGRQGGVDAMFALLIMVLVCAVAAWLFGRWGAPVRLKRVRVGAKLLALTFVLWALYFGIQQTQVAYREYGADAYAGEASGQWQAWSSERVEAELAAGRPVFVDFTASWCLICQVNKKLALRTEATEALFVERGIVALEADWTRRDSQITDALESFGRSGVPLYLLYAPDGEVTVLPQSLTNGTIRQAVTETLGD